MVELRFIFFCCLINYCRCQNHLEIHQSRTSNLAAAVEKVYETNNETGLTVTLITPNYLTNKMQDFKHELLTKAFLKLHFGFRHETSENLRAKRFRRSSIILIQKFEDFVEISMRISPDFFKFNGFFVIVLIDGKIDGFEEIFKLLWSKQIFNVIVMFEIDFNSTSVMTFMPFSNGTCSNTTPIQINEFRDGSFETNNVDMFPEKMRDLNKCQVRVSVSNSTEPFIFAKMLPNGTRTFSGRDISLITALAESLNFKLNYSYVGELGYLHENGSASGPFKALLLDGDADISVNNWFIKGARLKFFDLTSSYISDSMVFLVPEGKNCHLQKS